MRDCKRLARQVVEKLALQGLTRCEAHRMHQDVEAIPMTSQIAVHLVDLRIVADIQRQHDA
ncbi:MAG: hypothetical protein BWZ07_03251 [Alphaproteobacteria bacterium ADurb.BinA280]|nr:MAG: hypothetical protein BWZ07_03251 [Alphaproteobacteria bacterium ADurb.BinA280]